MLSETDAGTESVKSILKRSEIKQNKKNVSIFDELSIIESTSEANMQVEDNEKFISLLDNDLPLTCQITRFKNQDRSTSPDNKFCMEEFLNNLESNIDINKVNESEVTEEIFNNMKQRNVNCNTYYTSDIYTLHNIIDKNQDKKKTKEERKKEREKKKEEEMLKKYQIEQEAKHKAIAKSKCGRWVKFNIKIGEGGYKFVYRGYDVEEAKNVAWCEFKREHVDTKEKRQSMFRETEIMLKMNHSHIVRCFDVLREWHVYEDPQTIIDEKGIVIIQELMGEGTLKNIIKKNFLEGHCILKFPLITRWWHQILDALRYMHMKCDPPIIHRDLKADNCFLYGQTDDEYLNVKVGDFGLATHVHTSGRKTMLGTLGFMAPEIFDEKYDESVDIYAFGMLMLEVMTNRTPFDECDTIVQVAAKTLSGKGPKVIEMVSDKWLREIINSCIHPMSCFRPTAEELFFHPIFQSRGLPVEVELNYDNISDRTEVIDRFIANIPHCMKINLRLRFRDKRMLQELGLDDGESLEFDLDIYKAEDQDIPDLIQNLRTEYEDKLSRVYANPKIQDKSMISSHLDRLFLSIKLQMHCLVKHLLGRRWRDILDSLVANKNAAKSSEGEMESGDDQDDGAMNSLTIISQYKGMWTKAKRSLDKEMSAYRANPHKDSSASSKTEVNSFHVDEKPSNNLLKESISVPDNDFSENEKLVILDYNINPKNAVQSLVEGNLTYLNVVSDTDQIENAIIINKDSFQLTSIQGSSIVSTTNSNSINNIDTHNDMMRDINSMDITMNKDSDHCETDFSKETLSIQKNGSYNVKIQNIESNLHSFLICVTFTVEIPDFSKSESGKWVLCFKCVINEHNSIDNLELNTADVLTDKIDNDIHLVLRETLVRILKLIQTDRKRVPINQNFVFYPRSENIFFSEPIIEKCVQKADDQLHIDSGTIILNETKPNIIENNFMENHINIDSLFDQENTILLTKRVEDDKNITRAYCIPPGSAIVINNNGQIQNITKTTIISPKLDSNENIFVRELDKSDLSMDKAIHILTLLQEKIEELSTKNLNQFSELTSKILFETKLIQDSNKKTQIYDFIDKNKIIEQVLMQNSEIEKLQKQQSELISLLSNQQLLFSAEPDSSTGLNANKLISNSEQDILNTHKLNNKIYSNNYGQPFINSNQMLMNNDPRVFMPNNVYINTEDIEYQNSNNFLMDSAIRNQLVHKTSLNENIMFNPNPQVNKDFVSVDASLRLKTMKEMGNIVDVNRVYPDIYSNDRVDYFDRNMYQQLHYHSKEPITDNEIHCKMNSGSSVPNIQERLPPDYKNPDSNMTQPMYQSKYHHYYQIPIQKIRNDHQNFMTLKDKSLINYRVPQSMQNYFDPSMIVVAQSYTTNNDEMNNLRKEQLLYDHGVGEEMKMNDHNYAEKQIQPDQNIFSVTNNFVTPDNNNPLNINYHENNFSINQKTIDKVPEACINIQLNNPLEDKNKDVFINR